MRPTAGFVRAVGFRTRIAGGSPPNARIGRCPWLDAAHSTVWLGHGYHDHWRTYIDIILERGRFEMMERIAATWPSPRARVTAVVYLLYFLTAVGDDVFVGRGRLVVYDAVNLIAHAFYIAVTLLFYYMFKPVSRSLSLLAAFFSLVGCANDVLTLFNLAPFRISSVVFFAPYCLLIGYLIFRSTFLPGILGVLMAFAGLGWLIFLSPLAKHLSTYLMVLGFLAEASLMLWLLVMGVNVERWKEQASEARSNESSRS
jgi:hypothetical protein